MILSDKELIFFINRSSSYVDIFNDGKDWHQQYKDIIKKIHPDKCNLDGSKEAVSKLNKYKDELEKGKTYNDDVATITYKIDSIRIVGDLDSLKKTNNYLNKLLSYKDPMDKSFQRYIPYKSTIDDDSLYLYLKERCVPITSLGVLPQEHVNWILSRMLEYIAYLHLKGISHCGINPDSVYIDPINHGIYVISFYHSTELNGKMKTASGKYLHFYPEHVKTKKIATPDVDIELCKKTAIYLLGDKSGIGNSLRKTHSNNFLDFIIKPHYDGIECFKQYREMLDKNFNKKFIKLNI
jgi:serine/threonine protein kinase